MASRTEVRPGTDARGEKRDGHRSVRWIFAAAIVLTAVWLVGLIVLARWLIVTLF